ncbi:MAG: GatB/YqeY domain-containing protein [Lachnospiraceae bacterium]
MNKIEEVRRDMIAAMKAGEKEKKETLSMLLSALKNKAIDKREDLTQEEEIQVILKEIKQTKETLETTPVDRTAIIEECNKRLAVLEQYAPQMMDETAIREIIAATLSELSLDTPTAKDKGKIMKALMPKVKGKSDGKLVNDIVSTFMTE